MKRSEINDIMRESVKFFNQNNFFLPKFAFWTLDEWMSKGPEIKEIINNHLGWDITDFGSGDFSKNGLVHFTIRNGDVKNLKKGGKPYCEKIMIVNEEQITPLHHHYKKIEDIINRGGGTLLIQLYNATKNDELDNHPVKISFDGVEKLIQTGDIIELNPGDSVTLTPKHYHRFWAKKGGGKVLIGEVSSVNDDYVDNKFYDAIIRFSIIEEDEKPLYLLCNDYKKYIKI